MCARKVLFSLILLIAACIEGKTQQNVQFSQYVFNGLSVNPAYAGYKDAWYLNSVYRYQWTGFPGGPRTGSVSIDGPIRPLKTGAGIGLGLQLMTDRLGPQQSNSFYASYSYRIPIDEDQTRRLCFGLAAGVTQYHLQGNTLEYFDSEDPVFPGGTVNAYTPDARFGVYYHAPSFYIGVSVLDLFSRYLSSQYHWKGFNYQNIRRSRHLYLATGIMVPLSEHVQLKPSILIKDDFKGPTNLDVTTMLLIDRIFWIGGSFRTAVPLWKRKLPSNLQSVNAASAIVEYYIADKWRIGYAYDLNINEMAGKQGGSHEISVGVLFPSKKFTTSSPRYF
ncbi:PorP/SprF family type IX secretion system membrane protein [Chitinophaga tropicalis]|uniref:Type IX secretion system membrane protein PorP/SprF n=1 Tax=Chitinophaga tropicalis TaxID=2683588 RepID=A0A7K1U0M6_9BACT|nr:type IX secretion system membrane protein PorP/SprF [Chitinophaga tropicalis]MVT07924.1 type IX secretion system membrane protein PorP/SprF [Chitinophaga tropicalis]